MHPFPLDLVPPPIFDCYYEHTFVLDRILFAQALTTTPHLYLGGLSMMVYEHLLGCFILEDPSSRFLKIFQVVVFVVHGVIPKSVALMLGASKLLVYKRH
jgi:hypothetical protein